jgi:tetratricopeptide (TPR) repeat protein
MTYTCTRARALANAHTHTRSHTRKCRTGVTLPPLNRSLSLCCCQIKAWRAGHKGECAAVASAGTRTTFKMTADQKRLTKILEQLAGAHDWRGLAAQERAALAVAAAVRTSIPRYAAWVYYTLGRAYHMLGNFSKALEHRKVLLTIKREVGDRAGEGEAYGNLGNAYQSLGDYAKAIEYHTQHLAIAKELGDRAGEGCVYGNLGSAHDHLRDYAQSIQYHEQCLAVAKEVGDRAGMSRAYGNLGNAFRSQGDFSKAIQYLAQQLAISKDMGDRKGEGRAYGNLGNVYQTQGDFSRAIKHHTLHLAIAKKVGDRVGLGRAYDNLGTCHMHLNEHDKAVAYFEAQHALGISLEFARLKSSAALNMGVALTLQIRAARQGTATGAEPAAGPHSHPSASALLDDRVREAAKWLQAAFDGGQPFAKLHLAHLTFLNAGQQDALAHLKEHLSCLVQGGRNLCLGCWQTRGEDTPMLTCSGCRVARFCSADHQKMASKKAALGGSLWTGRHNDMCRVLGKWREVVNDGVAPDSCTADLVAFLQQEKQSCQ